MVGAVAEVVEATFSVDEETTGSGAHAVAIGAFDDMRCGRECSKADGVVLGSGPEAKDHEIRLSGLPPEWVSNVLLRNPKNGRDGRFRISDFGMRTGIWGGMWQHYFVPRPAFAGHVYTWLRDFEGLLPRVISFVRYCIGWVRLGRRMHDKVGIVAKVTESFCQKAQVPVPEKVVGGNGKVSVEEDFQDNAIW